MQGSRNNTPRRRAFLGAMLALVVSTGLAGCTLLVGAYNVPPPTGVVYEVSPVPAGPSPSPSLTAPSPSPAPSATVTPRATATDTVAPTAMMSPTPTTAPTAEMTPEPSPTPAPQPTPDGVVRRLRVPILMYHYLSTPPPGADAVRRSLSVSPETFAEHLRYLKEAGWETISLEDLALALQIGQPLPERPIIITFDDGYSDNYYEAFPLLRSYGFTATFFLITEPIDRGDAAYVSWDQVIEMHAAGMEIGAHSYTHPDLSGKDVDYVVWQTLGPREAIEERIQEPVRFFCYPSGEYDEQVIRVLHSAHYWGAVSITAGVEHTSDAMFDLTRVRVPGHLSAGGLDATLYGYMSAP